MKKIRKGKKRLITLLAILIAVILLAIIVIIIRKNITPKEPENPNQIISLPETTYSDMKVQNIQMEYLEANDQTSITMEINNTTANKVEKEKFDVVWLGKNEEILGKIITEIKSLEAGEQQGLTVVLPGNLTKTKEIKLIKK